MTGNTVRSRRGQVGVDWAERCLGATLDPQRKAKRESLVVDECPTSRTLVEAGMRGQGDGEEKARQTVSHGC